MNRYRISVVVLALVPPLAFGADTGSNGNEVMMSVVGTQDANEQQFVDEIPLPAQGTPRGKQDSGIGHEGDNGALDQGNMAAEARERAQENARRQASEARTTARESRDARQQGRNADRARPNGPGAGAPDNRPEPGNGNPPPKPGNP